MCIVCIYLCMYIFKLVSSYSIYLIYLIYLMYSLTNIYAIGLVMSGNINLVHSFIHKRSYKTIELNEFSFKYILEISLMKSF